MVGYYLVFGRAAFLNASQRRLEKNISTPELYTHQRGKHSFQFRNSKPRKSDGIFEKSIWRVQSQFVYIREFNFQRRKKEEKREECSGKIIFWERIFFRLFFFVINSRGILGKSTNWIDGKLPFHLTATNPLRWIRSIAYPLTHFPEK